MHAPSQPISYGLHSQGSSNGPPSSALASLSTSRNLRALHGASVYPTASLSLGLISLEDSTSSRLNYQPRFPLHSL